MAGLIIGIAVGIAITALDHSDFDGNEKSRRCQEKCGFRFHHTERDVHWAATDEIKTEHYSILTRAEWLARQKPED